MKYLSLCLIRETNEWISMKFGIRGTCNKFDVGSDRANIINLLDLRFSKRRLLRLLYYNFTYFSEEHTASVFRDKE
jgi:hypothetical protein